MIFKSKVKSILTLFLLLITFFSCENKSHYTKEHSKINYSCFDYTVTNFVDPNGNVNYSELQKHPDSLEQFINQVKETKPSTTWSREEIIAFWINVYNAFTLKLIIDNYPISSIKELHPTPYIPMVNTVWHQEIFIIGEEKISLNTIEHDILREDFKEPRIHFAINCASRSCPKLRNEAYRANSLLFQLEDQTKTFINDSCKNILTKNRIALSPIFSWFENDFTERESLTDFINRHSTNKINPRQKIEFGDYNWALNEQKEPNN